MKLNKFTGKKLVALSAMLSLITMAVVFAANARAANNSIQTNDVVDTAVAAGQFKTLAAALEAADLIGALKGQGPFTVFAPTNEAFNKLPKGALDELMKAEKKTDLQNVLQYHVTTSSLKANYFKDGQTIGMVNGDNISVSVKDGKVVLNNSATIIASVQASNGMVHIVDAVLLPPAKK